MRRRHRQDERPDPVSLDPGVSGDRVSRWSGPGNAEFRRALDKAKGKDQVIRLVMARSHDPAAVDSGQDASKIKKSFEPREDWFGKLILWDGENYEIEFRRR